MTESEHSQWKEREGDELLDGDGSEVAPFVPRIGTHLPEYLGRVRDLSEDQLKNGDTVNLVHREFTFQLLYENPEDRDSLKIKLIDRSRAKFDRDIEEKRLHVNTQEISQHVDYVAQEAAQSALAIGIAFTKDNSIHEK